MNFNLYFLQDTPIYTPIVDFVCKQDADCGTSYCIDQVCTCKTQFYGQTCNMTATQCAESFCNNNGYCGKINNQELFCTCNQNYIMQNCNFTIESCQQSLCNSHGTCIYNNETLNATCNCSAAYMDDVCTICSAGFTLLNNECISNSCIEELTICNNGGNCVQIIDKTQVSYQCSCQLAYTGQYCGACSSGYQQINISSKICTTESCIANNTVEGQSILSVCNDHGQCSSTQGCMCQDEYFGKLCENEVICYNGIAVSGTCSCSEGFIPVTFTEQNTTCYNANCVNQSETNIVCSNKPALCSTETNQCECQSNNYNLAGQYCQYVCKDHCTYGTCYVNELNVIACNCPEYMSGDKCDVYNCPSGLTPLQGTCTASECINQQLTICNQAGVCDILSKQCTCNNGYYGNVCQTTQAECNADRCNGKGQCLTNGSCYCYNGIYGNNCISCNTTEYNISNVCVNSSCISDILNLVVCANHGTCDSAVCKCEENYTNIVCNETIDDCNELHCNSVGLCVVNSQQLTCDCQLMNYGINCTLCEETEEVQLVADKYCSPVDCIYEETVCSFAGTCETGVCICENSFGQYCEIDGNNCSINLCSNHGACYYNQIQIQNVQEGNSEYVTSYDDLLCNCSQHYTGNDCSVCPSGHTLFLGQCVLNGWFDKTDKTICNNQGFIGYDAICVCNEGWIGRTCNLTVRNCNQNLCDNQGICDELGQYCSCSSKTLDGDFCQKCAKGYFGKNCISTTPFIIVLIIILIIAIVLIIVFAYLKYQKKAKIGQMKQIKKVGFGFNKMAQKIEGRSTELKI